MFIFCFVYVAAKVMFLINPTNNLKAIEFLTTLDPTFTNQNLKVCSNIYENMQLGDYGSIDNSILDKYRTECNRLWPKANLFQSNPPPPSYSSCDVETNGGNSGTVADNQN
jgi:hypothetical protein